jgi:hypothetical protein
VRFGRIAWTLCLSIALDDPTVGDRLDNPQVCTIVLVGC